MPGLWVHLKDNPDFFQDFNPGTGEYFECTLYDEGHREQGKGVWRVSGPETEEKGTDLGSALPRTRRIWAAAKLHCCQRRSPLLVADKGRWQGRVPEILARLHFCVSDEANCSKTKKKPKLEFHTDYFRTLDAVDLVNLRVPWFKVAPGQGRHR